VDEDDQLHVTVCRYVHSEMSEKERAAFDRAIANDPALAETVRRFREMDNALHGLLPLEPMRDEAMENEILEALERDMAAPKQRSSVRIMRIVFPMLAAAALLLAVVGVSHLLTPTVRWEPPEVSMTAFRGEGPDAQTASAAAAAVEGAVQELQRRVEKGWRRRAGLRRFRSGRASLIVVARGLRNGAVSVEVRLLSDGEPERTLWFEQYGDVNAFRRNIASSAGDIADRLAHEEAREE